MKVIRDCFKNKNRVDFLEDEKVKLEKTILRMSIQLEAIRGNNEYLQKENEKLKWTLENKRIY
jgi:hypothetical protein